MTRDVIGSVVIPAFNAERFLAASVGSALASIDHCATVLDAFAPEDMRVVIVDDGSSDNTEALAQDLAAQDPRVLLVLGRENGGAGPARNAGAAAAPGEILFYLDADDRFLPDHVCGCLLALLGAPEVGFVQSGIALPEVVDPDWKTALERSVVFNIALWKDCHDFVGGFLETPELKTLRCEDVLYRRALFHWFQGRTVGAETVAHSRHPGNAFDRQRDRFAGDPDALDDLDGPERAVWPQIEAAARAQAAAVAARVASYEGPVPLLGPGD